MTIPMGPNKTCLRGDALATRRILHHTLASSAALHHVNVSLHSAWSCTTIRPFGSRSGGDQYGVLFGMWSTNGRWHSGVLELRESCGTVRGRRSGGGNSAGSIRRIADQRRRSVGIFILDPSDHFPGRGTV